MADQAYQKDVTSVNVVFLADVAQKAGRSFDLKKYLQEEGQIKAYINDLNRKRGTTNEELVSSYQKMNEAIELLLSKNPTPDSMATFIQYVNSYGWYQLLTRDFVGAQATIERGIKLDASHAYFYTNLPPALLFQGNKGTEAMYKEWASKPYTPDLGTYPTYAHVFLADFEVFEKEGVVPEKHREAMEKIKADLQKLVEEMKDQ